MPKKHIPKFQKFVELFLSESQIHGFAHLGQKQNGLPMQILWLCIIIAAVYGALRLSLMTVERYTENPTVISMERDKFSWNTSFPSTTICPKFKLEERLLEAYVQNSTAENKTLFKEFLVTLAEASYDNFERIVPYDNGLTGDDFLEIIIKLKFDFKPSITNSALENNTYGLEEVISEMGICYSFNSQLARYNAPSYWSQGSWQLFKETQVFYVNPLDGEIFANLINMSTGFNIYIHGPFEVADIASKNIDSPNGYFLQLFLNGLTIFSDEKIKSLSVNQRKCRFYYESDLRHSPVYSYVLCRMECRAKLTQKLCGCIPHFYRKLDGLKYCNLSGLYCLSNHKERLIILKGECSCLPNCDEVNYIIEWLDTRQWFLGSNLQWGLKEYPKMRLRRDVIFGFTELLVYIGGMVGLFLGCSVLSFIEIVYFFTLRLYWFFRSSRSVSHKVGH